MKKSKGIRVALVAGAVALPALAVSAAVRYRREIHEARKRIASGSRIAETPCGPIQYAVAGSGPPVLVVHGAGGGFDQGLEFGRFLVEAGHTVIAISRFGYLGTPLPSDASPQAQADAHACLLDALNLSQVAVLGGSAGAPSSMQFALRYPERCAALVLLVPAAYAPGVSMGQPSVAAEWAIRTMLRSDFSFWAIMKLSPRSMIHTLLATPESDFQAAAPQERDRVTRAMRLILPVSRRAKGLENDSRICSRLDRYELERIVAPTLILTTENDLFRTLPGARYTAERIPNARFVSYPTGGHMWVGREAEVSAVVSRFLENSAGASGQTAGAPAAERRKSLEALGPSVNLIHSTQALEASR
jgi:2-hydroxy-6-oxonona-2,4-dienedioate hydrolase